MGAWKEGVQSPQVRVFVCTGYEIGRLWVHSGWSGRNETYKQIPQERVPTLFINTIPLWKNPMCQLTPTWLTRHHLSHPPLQSLLRRLHPNMIWDYPILSFSLKKIHSDQVQYNTQTHILSYNVPSWIMLNHHLCGFYPHCSSSTCRSLLPAVYLHIIVSDWKIILAWWSQCHFTIRWLGNSK